MRVTLYTFDDKPVGTVTVVGGKAVATGIGDFLADTTVVEPNNPDRVLTPADGEEYLRAIPQLLRGNPYLYAKAV